MSNRPRRQEERKRFNYVKKRDGEEAAKEWALVMVHLYRKALLDPNHFSRREPYRSRYIRSYLYLKRKALS